MLMKRNVSRLVLFFNSSFNVQRVFVSQTGNVHFSYDPSGGRGGHGGRGENPGQASRARLLEVQEAILPLSTPAAFISPQYRRRTGKKMKEKLSTLCWLLLCPNLNRKHHGRVENRKKDLFEMENDDVQSDSVLVAGTCPLLAKLLGTFQDEHHQIGCVGCIQHIAGIPSRSKLSSPTTVFAHCWW